MSTINTDLLPLTNGKCQSCADNNNCPMKDMLPLHRKHVLTYGEEYWHNHPEFEEDAIDEPEFEDDRMIWCPMFYGIN